MTIFLNLQLPPWFKLCVAGVFTSTTNDHNEHPDSGVLFEYQTKICPGWNWTHDTLRNISWYTLHHTYSQAGAPGMFQDFILLILTLSATSNSNRNPKILCVHHHCLNNSPVPLNLGLRTPKSATTNFQRFHWIHIKNSTSELLSEYVPLSKTRSGYF